MLFDLLIYLVWSWGTVTKQKTDAPGKFNQALSPNYLFYLSSHGFPWVQCLVKRLLVAGVSPRYNSPQ